jgi:hypothetical protein
MTPIIQVEISPRADKLFAQAGGAELFPEELSAPITLLRLRIPEGDPRLQQALDTLQKAQIPPLSRSTEYSPTGNYKLVRLHSYEPGELEAAAHVMLWVMDEPQCFGDAQPQRVDGKLVIDEHQYRFGYKVRRKKFKMWECERSLLVDAQIRDEMIAANFRGLAFRETLLGRRPSSGLPPAKLVPVAPGQEMFELVPTIELPPMVPEMVVKHGHTHVNPGFDDFQPVYRQTNLASAFDIARASELVNAYGDPESRLLIMSQRFHQYCMKYCKHGGFLPVLEVD